MKKISIAIATIMAFTGLVGSTVANAAHETSVKFICPSQLNNLSSSITGIGSEKIGSAIALKVQFKGLVPATTPLDLSSYSSSNTKYDASLGKVTCQYMSSTGYPIVYVS